MHKSSLCLLALAVLLVAGLDAAGSAKMAKSPRNRQLTMKKAAAASGKNAGYRNGGAGTGVMPMKNFHKLSMAMMNGDKESNLFGAYGNGKALNLMRTKPSGGGGASNFIKAHANRVHKPISYQKQNQMNQKERLRTLKMNVLAKAARHHEEEEDAEANEEPEQQELERELPVVGDMIITNNNVNVKEPHAEMLRSRGPGPREPLINREHEEMERERPFVPEGERNMAPPPPPPAELVNRENERNERIQPVRAVATKERMQRPQVVEESHDEYGGSYDEPEPPKPEPPKRVAGGKGKNGRAGGKQQQQQQSQQKKRPAKANAMRGGGGGGVAALRNKIPETSYDDEDSDVHALKAMRMKKLEQQRAGLSDQASLTIELLSRQNPGMSFLKQFALQNYMSHMG